MSQEPIHICHAIACYERIPPHLLMCGKHWYMVPQPLRTAVWRAYKPGQEVSKQPSRAYLEAARNAINRVAAIEGHRPLDVEAPIVKLIPKEGQANA